MEPSLRDAPITAMERGLKIASNFTSSSSSIWFFNGQSLVL
jgi:hypothetical protein